MSPRDSTAGPAPEKPAEVVEATLDRVVYTNPDNGWTVARLTLDGEAAPLTAVGSLHGTQPGERLRLTGKWVDDAKYGRQFAVESFLALEPSTLAGLTKFLGSGLITGIGPAMAERLVERFGIETLEVIESAPERLREVEGIGPVRAERITKAYLEQREQRDAMVFLQGYGVPARLAVRICERYGNQTVSVLRENPYRLASEMFGVGFKTADRIAASLGLEPTSPQRVRAGLLHTLSIAADDGHVYLPRGRLVSRAADLLGVDPPRCEEALAALAEQGRLVVEPIPERPAAQAVYAPDLHRAEVGIARDLARLASADLEPVDIKVDRAVDWFERRQGFEFAPRQREAIRRGLTDRLVVITGGPGTGKTTLVRAITEILRRKNQRLALAAPTGRAANRLADATGLEARTLHRLLEYDPHSHGFLRGPGRPLELDVLIVDDVSMMDCALTHLLLAALPSGSRLVLLGDADQLPSVGPGRVLHDLIASERLHVVPLTEIFRQARSSRIVRNAHLVNRGELPDLDNPAATAGSPPGSDFFFVERRDPERILKTVRRLVTERIPDAFGLDPRRDVQVLTPMRRGLLGTIRLNEELQALLNPTTDSVQRGATRLGIGDRVMQARNNYDLGVFNGDIGPVAELDRDDETVLVSFDVRRVAYGLDDLDQLSLAYACSVHKSQGSEYPCVVLPLHSQHHVMLQRNLLYTALTRARDLAVIVGTRQAVRTAVRNHRPRRRYTLLASRVREAVPRDTG